MKMQKKIINLFPSTGNLLLKKTLIQDVMKHSHIQTHILFSILLCHYLHKGYQTIKEIFINSTES